MTRMCERCIYTQTYWANDLMMRVTEPQTETNPDPAADDDAIDVGDDIAADEPDDEACGSRCRERTVKAAKVGVNKDYKLYCEHDNEQNQKARLKRSSNWYVHDGANTERGAKTEPRDNACSPLHHPPSQREAHQEHLPS